MAAARLLTLTPVAGCGTNAVFSASTPAVAARPSDAETTSRAVDAEVTSEPTRWGVVATHHHGVMLGMRLTEIWLWPEPFAETEPLVITERYRAAAGLPKWQGDARWFEWDGDRWWINVAGHSLFGSELYLAARRCKFAPAIALAAATAGSLAWEYGYEASGVRPSALDLVYTPLSGLALGELRHWVYDRAGALSDGPVKVVVRVLMDPLGSIERGLGAPC